MAEFTHMFLEEEHPSWGEWAMAEELLDYFTIHVARSQAELDRIQHLRWQVYCHDFHYEREEDCVGERESDAYDNRAVHAYAVHQPSGLTAGCVRIIRATSLEVGETLPIHKAYLDREDPETGWMDGMRRDTLFEVSRLAVSSRFRRRKGEESSPLGAVDAGETLGGGDPRALPMLSLALILSATAMGELYGLHDACAMMQPRLARLLMRFGIEFKQVAPMIDYHGRRAAFHVTVEDAVHGIQGEARELYEAVRATLRTDLRLDARPGGERCRS